MLFVFFFLFPSFFVNRTTRKSVAKLFLRSLVRESVWKRRRRDETSVDEIFRFLHKTLCVNTDTDLGEGATEGQSQTP